MWHAASTVPDLNGGGLGGDGLDEHDGTAQPLHAGASASVVSAEALAVSAAPQHPPPICERTGDDGGDNRMSVVGSSDRRRRGSSSQTYGSCVCRTDTDTDTDCHPRPLSVPDSDSMVTSIGASGSSPWT
jgi:hypothetical protein